MARFNARRFNQPTTVHGTTSGESPRLLPSTRPPGTSPPGVRCFPTDAFTPTLTTANDKLIRIARPQDGKFLASLQRKFNNALGFLPQCALNEYIENRRVGIITENGEPAGYILGRTHYRYQPAMRPICQTAIAMDAQRRHLGLALVARVCKQALDAHQLAVQAVCAEDLEANEFWEAAGFVPIDVLHPQNARNRGLIVWRKQLTSTCPDWFFVTPTSAGTRPRKR